MSKAAELTTTHTHMGSTDSSSSLASNSRISSPTSKHRINPCILYIMDGKGDTIRIYTSQSFTKTKKSVSNYVYCPRLNYKNTPPDLRLIPSILLNFGFIFIPFKRCNMLVLTCSIDNFFSVTVK